MYRKLFVSLLIAALMMVLATAVVSAQDTGEMMAETPTVESVSGVVSQAVPVTLTVSVPMSDGVQIVEVPIVLTVDVKVSLDNDMTASVEVMPAVTESEAMTETETMTDTEAMTETEEAATEEVVEEPVAETDEAAAEEVAEEPATEAEETVAEEPAEETVAEEPVAEEEAAADEEMAADEEATDAEMTDEEMAADEEAEAEEEMAEEVDLNCTDPRSIIYTPEAGDVVSGTMEVYGTANHQMFRYYKLEYQAVDSESGEYAFIVDNEDKVVDGLLAVLDTTELANGDYVLRLTVVDATGNFPPQCSVPVTIMN